MFDTIVTQGGTSSVGLNSVSASSWFNLIMPVFLFTGITEISQKPYLHRLQIWKRNIEKYTRYHLQADCLLVSLFWLIYFIFLTHSLSGQFFPECQTWVWFSFAEVPAGYVLWCWCTAELHVLNDEYTHQWHLTMHFNWRDNSSVTVNVLMCVWHYNILHSLSWSSCIFSSL